MTRRPLIDDHGRLLGRVNLVDAAVAGLVLLAIPVAYLAFLLFRSSRPVITSVEPAQLTYIEERASAGTHVAGKLKVHGRGLQPVLRASIGDHAAIAFVFESPASADVLFGDLPEGAHDLILYDGAQEVARAPNAVTIPSKPTAGGVLMRVAGTLIDLDEPAGRGLRVGQAFPPSGRPEAHIVALGDLRADLRQVSQARGLVDVVVDGRWQRPAAIVMSCDPSVPLECRVNAITLGLAGRVMQVPGSAPPLKLRVEEIVPATEPVSADARMRFVASPETVDLIRVGDRDESAPIVDGRAASIVAIGARQTEQGDMSVETSVDGAQSHTILRAPGRVAVVEVDVRMGVDPAQTGYNYRTRPIASGVALTFTTSRYVIKGTVLTLTVRGGPTERP